MTPKSIVIFGDDIVERNIAFNDIKKRGNITQNRTERTTNEFIQISFHINMSLQFNIHFGCYPNNLNTFSYWEKKARLYICLQELIYL